MKKMNKGFSLIELIVVIAIMAVLLAVLAPALLGYVERSRMQRDDSAMGEVVHSFKLALCDYETYDEAYRYATNGNYLTYTDSSGVYGQRIADEEYWNPDGSGKCLTITFNPDENGNYKLGEGLVNNMAGEEVENQRIFDDIKRLNANVEMIVGQTVENVSATYKNSSYTVFIVFDGNINVYGQWNGTNLPEVAEIPEGEGSTGCDHNYIQDGPYTINGRGYYQMTCNKCNDSYREFIEHEHTIETITVDATCTTSGHTEYRCVDCGALVDEAYTSPLAHDYQETNRVEPQVNIEGEVEYTCSGCGAKKYDVLPALPGASPDPITP